MITKLPEDWNLCLRQFWPITTDEAIAHIELQLAERWEETGSRDGLLVQAMTAIKSLRSECTKHEQVWSRFNEQGSSRLLSENAILRTALELAAKQIAAAEGKA